MLEASYGRLAAVLALAGDMSSIDMPIPGTDRSSTWLRRDHGMHAYVPLEVWQHMFHAQPPEGALRPDLTVDATVYRYSPRREVA